MNSSALIQKQSLKSLREVNKTIELVDFGQRPDGPRRLIIVCRNTAEKFTPNFGPKRGNHNTDASGGHMFGWRVWAVGEMGEPGFPMEKWEKGHDHEA
jgi:hypothetical protein